MKTISKLLLLLLIIGYYVVAMTAACDEGPKFKEGDLICFDDNTSKLNKENDYSCRRILKIDNEKYYFKYENIKVIDIIFNSNIIEFEFYKKY